MKGTKEGVGCYFEESEFMIGGLTESRFRTAQGWMTGGKRVGRKTWLLRR